MKRKRQMSLFLVAVFVLGILSGCGENGRVSSSTQKDEATATYLSSEEETGDLQKEIDSAPNTETEIAPADTGTATYLSTEEDARLKEDLQKEIDFILNTESSTLIPIFLARLIQERPTMFQLSVTMITMVSARRRRGSLPQR